MTLSDIFSFSFLFLFIAYTLHNWKELLFFPIILSFLSCSHETKHFSSNFFLHPHRNLCSNEHSNQSHALSSHKMKRRNFCNLWRDTFMVTIFSIQQTLAFKSIWYCENFSSFFAVINFLIVWSLLLFYFFRTEHDGSTFKTDRAFAHRTRERLILFFFLLYFIFR